MMIAGSMASPRRCRRTGICGVTFLTTVCRIGRGISRQMPKNPSLKNRNGISLMRRLKGLNFLADAAGYCARRDQCGQPKRGELILMQTTTHFVIDFVGKGCVALPGEGAGSGDASRPCLWVLPSVILEGLAH
jgi:hypothetical protein